MKACGLLLVLIGGVVLAYQGVMPAANPAAGGAPVPPAILGGIAVVAGLLFLASGGRRVE